MRPYQVIADQSAGSRMPRTDLSIVSKEQFYIPDLKPEQEKIEEFKHANLQRLFA
jgi:hypothetical protein